ncbi:ATP-binding protein [Micromonospora sp. DR5-3]|uniref:sensor histidine kinase n=1 Tax=unclassified Micromonospora TaxID=2617518 RepID=UPI0011D980CE|nr:MULTISPECIES: ATP-binding protein [unclassified Micromonospora]MCW3816715.1 ATP-binding protein [Micromonospora sp. DR5-3]TYC22572.1 sensor histidine kinase [Micromonospora sp. MP36]
MRSTDITPMSSVGRRRVTWRQRAARWLDPTVAQWDVAPQETPEPPPPQEPPPSPWPAICEQFAMRIMASAYQMGSHLEAVEADEQDPDRLERLYRIDHANTRIRRHAENLQVLLGRRVEDANPQTVPLVDVVRAASSAVEHYARIRVGHVLDLAVVEFAADDVIRVLTELLDNATRFSPPTAPVIVSAFITEDGGTLLRIEDAGVGLHPDHLAQLNALLGGRPLSPATLDPTTHLGLAVVAHLAVAHQLRVTLTNRPSGGTTATVLVPGGLLCEIPAPAGPDPASPAPAWPPPPGPVPGQAGMPTPPPAWPPAPAGGGTHPWSRPVATPPDSTHSPTVRLATLGGPTADQQPAGGLPKRVPASVRDDPTAAARQPADPDAGSPPEAWPDETAAFAAGVSDARTTSHEGQQP